MLTGSTGSSDFPVSAARYDSTLGGVQDAFVARLSLDLSALLFSTHLGGDTTVFLSPAGPGRTWATAIAVDGNGTVTITGGTDTNDFPLRNPLQAAYGGGIAQPFITKLNATGTDLISSSYLGESGQGYDLWLQPDGRTLVVGSGQIAGSDPSGAFLVELSANHQQLNELWTVGGQGSAATAVAVDANQHILVTGWQYLGESWLPVDQNIVVVKLYEPNNSVSIRTISYTYDGLNRLTGAVESGATTSS